MKTRGFAYSPTLPAALLMGAISAFPSAGQTARTSQLLRVVIRSFIPNEHPHNPGYIRAIPGSPGLFSIPSPEPRCFYTDGRGFSTGLQVHSRATTEFVLDVEGTSVKLATAADRDMFRIEPLRSVDCVTLKDIRPPRTPPAEPLTVDTLAFYKGIAQVVFSANVRDPFLLEPPRRGLRADAALSYGGSIILDTRSETLSFKGFVSVFPAFEGFVESERGIRTLFQVAPEAGATAMSLYAPQVSRTTRPIEVGISLR